MGLGAQWYAQGKSKRGQELKPLCLRGSGNDMLRVKTQAGLWGYDLPVGAHVCTCIPWRQALCCDHMCVALRALRGGSHNPPSQMEQLRFREALTHLRPHCS